MDGLEKILSNSTSAAIYNKLLVKLKNVGDFETQVKGGSIHIANGRAFLGVHPRRVGILLNIVTTEELKSDRLKKVERVSANRFHNEIELHNQSDFDAEVFSWIKEAYNLTLPNTKNW